MVSPREEAIPPNVTEYLTLMRDDTLQVKSGYCYYFLPPDWVDRLPPDEKLDYDALGRKCNAMWIMCVHRLWIDQQ